MTDLSSTQLTALTAILLGETPARASNKEKASTHLIATAEGYGLHGIKKIVAMTYEDAKAAIEAHAVQLAEAAAMMEVAAESTTRPRRRRTVSAPTPQVMAAPADLSGKAWFRSGEQAEARMLTVMIEVGPAKLAAFRAKFAEGQDKAGEFNALSQTPQNGILIRAMGKLMAAGKLTRHGLIYGVKE